MSPAFTRVVHHTPESSAVSMRHAGLWDSPQGCRFTGTRTFCTALVLWCVNQYVCPNNTPLGADQSTAPYPCGVCVGITNPSSW